MVTADRPHLARRAIHCYQQQTYPNKELVVLDNGETPIEDLLAVLPADELRYDHVEPGSMGYIGGLRNVSLEMATGQYIVPQWDDDDWYHPERLARQAAVLDAGHDACMLPATLMHVDHPDYFYRPFFGKLPNGVPPTIMHRRDGSIRYPDLRRTSDTPYTNEWRERSYVQMGMDAAHLYLRYSHGGNLWEPTHFLRRMRNTPRDLLAYGWWRYVRRDLFRHNRFQIGPDGQAAFRRYLEDSVATGIFEANVLEALPAE